MTDGREHPPSSENSPRADDLDTRMAAVESRLDQIDAALRALNAKDILRMHSAHQEHEKLLKELKKEQDSIASQTGSYSAETWEWMRPLLVILSCLALLYSLAQVN
jgi:hypothetical protein